MYSIFYDLETSDTLPIGQILNYSFIAVNAKYEIHSEISGLITISRLQLPSPGAVLANRVNVIEHQKIAHDNEKVAGRKIVEFITEVLRDAGGDVRLIGYNSSKFDLPFLRTTLIRNGLNPYIRNGTSSSSTRILNGDLLHVARKLVTTNEEFALATLKETETGELKRALTLQHLCQQFGLLTGVQLHESRADVLLTIELARVFHERFGIDVRTFRPYEGTPFHTTARTGKVFLERYPEYDITLDRSYSVSPLTLLDFSGSGALWINLMKYQAGEGRASILWRNTNDGWLFVEPADDSVGVEYHETALGAIKEFGTLTSQNYFTKSICDIEQDIYRLDFDAKDQIGNIIWKNENLRGTPSQDLKTILARHKLNHYEWGGSFDAKVESLLREYALYRYGGRAIISKFFNGEPDDTGSSNHPTLRSYFDELETKLHSANSEDTAILTALKTFYLESDIYRVAGKELMGYQ